MERLSHGYTNQTILRDGVIVKKYVGVGAADRQQVERACLSALPDLLPAPKLVAAGDLELRMTRLCGVHGKDLMDRCAASLMQAMGLLLRRVHGCSVRHLAIPGEGSCLVHGDFGPQNILFSRDGNEVTGLLDWEWAHFGEPIEDLAWIEWVVRKHHPKQQRTLPAFFDAYGWRPSWPDRQESMIRRCAELKRVDPVDRGSGHADSLWYARISEIRQWAPLVDE